ncbi:uncharacterized protein Z519_11593 [Cladophialophora bantiana CBS 173.52]|uniref:Uncharacterized protein n=1 Tax=Cladophialophora bantiana (strain ATCC 10958 / CBS 173.52 / CDC B-1940 / NIH 8579) TaxID=1442370 RepID=A0A0D2HT56_CLAB1|nr:uncharacterized protein Z519_11593 [Cladophialophora bantiana CBS 173.52]KIW87619.1 hypothetical protein Z519_11593 [Cladophialophora bantiana CBS 173.52]
MDESGGWLPRHPAAQRPGPSGTRALLTNYVEDVREIKTNESAVLVRKETRAESRTEQRISHLLIPLAIIGTMTRPLLALLRLMPRALFSGVFFVVGWGSIESDRIVKKILFLLRERR